MKSNIHKRVTFEDKFIRKWWKRNRSYRNEVRGEKKRSKRKFRRLAKENSSAEYADYFTTAERKEE